MSKRPKRDKPRNATSLPGNGRGRWLAIIGMSLALGFGTIWFVGNKHGAQTRGDSTRLLAPSNSPLPTVEVGQSLMSTVELDFGPTPPPMHEAIKEIERYSQPDVGVGRTFAVLDADGSVAPNGKLHIQMHLSMEKPGIGSLTFRRTGEILWKSKIVASTNGPPKPKQLIIYMATTTGQSYQLDGSKGLQPVLDLPIDKSNSKVRDLWPDGAEHEFTFIYSVCGCPVKAKVRRTGESTARTAQLPVMFPDDPDAMRVIGQIMGWPAAQ